MKQKLWMKIGLFILIVLMVGCSSGFALASESEKTKMLWESLAGEDYQRALELSIEQGRINPVYFELAFYLAAISFNSSHQFHQIREELYAAQIDSNTIESFINDMNEYLKKDTPFYKMVEAIIQFNEHRNQSRAIKLVEEALSEKETTLGHYLQYAFCDNLESFKKAALLAKRPGFLNEQLLFISYNQELNDNKEVNKEKFVSEIEKLLSSDDYYFDSQDYHYFIQMGLGKKFVSAVGPSGPNNEPFFGELCRINEWESFKKFAPRHQILFTFAVAGPGGQNTGDAERLLEYMDAQTLQAYAPMVKMIRIYENFHDYQYDAVYQGADDLLRMEITDSFYFTYIYDLAYEYEMFYFAGYHGEQEMIDKAVRLYDKAYELAPAESPYWKGCVLQGKGRSQFYAKEYQDSIDTLTLALTMHDDPICYIFLSLDYYAIEDLNSGAEWEKKVREVFANNDNVLRQFEGLLSEVKK